MGALPKEDRLFTYANYKAWELEEGERYELIYGEAYAMSGPGTPRQIVSGELYDQFFTFLEGKPCRVFSAPFDVRLFYAEDESDDTVVQPDIMVVRDKTKLGPEGVRGAPDLVIEILSPSNTAIEMEKKLDLYREAGVREYRVVDPSNKKNESLSLRGKRELLQGLRWRGRGSRNGTSRSRYRAYGSIRGN